MIEFEKLIIGLGLTSFGWILSECSHFLKNSREDKKVSKKVMYNLLEIYSVYLKIDFENQIYYLFDIMKDDIEVVGTEDEIMFDDYKEYLHDILKDRITPYFKNEVEEFEENLKCSIGELSAIDPVLAFSLNGQTKLFEKIDIANEYLGELNSKIQEDTGCTDDIGAKEIVDFISPEILNDTLDLIESSIEKLARSISFLYLIRVKRKLKEMKTQSNIGYKGDMDKLFLKIKQLATIEKTQANSVILD